MEGAGNGGKPAGMAGIGNVGSASVMLSDAGPSQPRQEPQSAWEAASEVTVAWGRNQRAQMEKKDREMPGQYFAA